MTLRACPLCGYRYNAPENQTCGKCKGWLGGEGSADAAVAAAPARRGPALVPRSPREALCYLPVPIGALLGFPNPIGAAFGLLMAALLLRVVRLDMERFSRGLLVGIVVAGVFFAYLVFLLLFGLLYALLEPILQPLFGRFVH
ncbi:MAG TPA: hypothetical protein VET65_02340 [Candidatus Limnocylindrales bacterium]|nr:hypothetical protein [Candidatus Limnocylindrales bacterium]